ncbi:MAG TPA: hypothetical protein VKS60_20335 [Stellaceae bacterium]|nr:hypothetical protein [Stellaceae bacterium]
MRKVLIAIVVIAVLGGGAYFLLKGGTERTLQAQLDDALHRLPPDWEVKYDGVDVSPAKRAATIKGLVIHYKPEPDAEIKAESVTVENPALDLDKRWADAMAHPDAVAEDAVFPVADAIEVRNLSVKSADQTFSAASARTEAFKMYPWPLTRPGLPKIEALPALLEKLKGEPTEAEMKPLLRFYGAAFLSAAYGKTDMQNLSVSGHIPPSPGMPAGNFTETFRTLQADGIDRGVVKSAEAGGISAEMGPEMSFTVARVAYADVDLRQPATRLAKGEELGPHTLDGMTLGMLEFNGMTVKVPTGQSVPVGGFGLGHVTVTGGMPVSGRVFLTKLALDRAAIPDEDSQQAFEKLGLDRATISFSAAYDWDLGAKRVSVHDTSLVVDELGTLDFSGEVADVTPQSNLMTDMKLAHARLQFQDKSLTDRLLKAGVKETGSNEATLKRQALETLRQAALMFPGDPAIDAGVKQVKVFLDSPKSLTVELAPKQPFSFATLEVDEAAPPKDLPSQLGLSVKANQ